MDEDTSKTKVDDEELENMIASIKGQPAAPPTVAGSGAPMASTPPATPPINSSMIPATDGATAAPTASAPIVPMPLSEPTTPPATSLTPTPPTPAPAVTTPPALPPELASIKQSTLAELRPLVDRLALPPEEKFNAILLIIRSTDDASLLPAARQAASAITDENRRAQALLDVIKEIDFFSQQAR
ncbi:hypothetical protein FWH58_02740 [Candidatus Saccharibacteria bacterium]|nr:hypothetical protein [Candidatus Saccharibacteria bacterium]